MGSSMYVAPDIYDDTGLATTYNGVPLRAVKRAFFRKGNAVFTLMKLVLNSVTYDFRETAQNGVVICPQDFSAIEFISPDGRIDYNSLKHETLQESLNSIISICETKPIPAWDRFAEFLGSNVANLTAAVDNVASVTPSTIDSMTVTEVNKPDFSGVVDAATLFTMVRDTIESAWSDPTSLYELDYAAFGFVLSILSVPDANGVSITFSLGFLFRE